MRRALVAAVLVGLPLAGWAGVQWQQRGLEAQRARLRTAAGSPPPSWRDEEVDALPAPVRRYLRWALPHQHGVRLVRLRQAGELRTDTNADRWMAFEAEHVAAPHARGFLWDARVRLAPLLHLRVRDSFIDGAGRGHVSLASALTVAGAGGTPEMNAGSLHRFLAEAVWYPSALLPDPSLRWRAIDDGRAEATLTVRDVSVSLEFRFAATGEVTGIFTPARWGRFDGGFEQRPWEGHFRGYELHDGVRVPMDADVGWYEGDDWRAVWRGRILAWHADGA